MAYYLRHGQCKANADGVFAGQEDDSDLTELGMQQTAQAAVEAKRQGVVIDRIICSPLLRTRRTAEIFAGAYGFELGKIEQDLRLLERKMGVISGTKVADAPKGDWSALAGVEPLGEVSRRVLGFWREHKGDSGLLVIGHDGAQKVLEAMYRSVPLQELYKLPSFPQDQLIDVDLSWL